MRVRPLAISKSAEIHLRKRDRTLRIIEHVDAICRQRQFQQASGKAGPGLNQRIK